LRMLKTDGFGGLAREGSTSCITQEYIYIINTLVSYECQTWFIILKEEQIDKENIWV
jgi:hypothetical protein